MEEALAWFRLMAMKQHLEPRDADFIDRQRSLALSRANALERSGDLYAAWRDYRQSASTFDELGDAALSAPFLQAASSLAAQKAVREGAKREKQEFQEQDLLTGDISAGLAALRQLSTNLNGSLSDTQRKIVSLRESIAHEKRFDRIRVLRRSIAGVFVEAMEAGQDRLEAKDVTLAKDYFLLASEADPESPWALNSLATARALGNDRRGTIEASAKPDPRPKTWPRSPPGSRPNPLSPNSAMTLNSALSWSVPDPQPRYPAPRP
jgi:hypothetical protein